MNSIGKGGFQDHPENINREGKNKKIEGLQKIIEDTIISCKDGENLELLPLTLKRLGEAVEAGKEWAVKLVMHYYFGVPKTEFKIETLDTDKTNTINLIVRKEIVNGPFANKIIDEVITT